MNWDHVSTMTLKVLGIIALAIFIIIALLMLVGSIIGVAAAAGSTGK